jgi:CDP-6-deoxy-D-xylo-4-hexulose-3-dehydrase
MNSGGETLIPVSGKVVGRPEVAYMTDAAQELVLTGGRWAKAFAQSLGKFLKRHHISLVNSGSSANLLALSALTSHEIPEERRLKPGDYVVTTATSFPTTVAPIYQIGCTPIYVDVELGNYNAQIGHLTDKIEVWKPKAMILAHTLGNPFDMGEVLKLCARYGIWLIEDNCDALGAEWNGRRTGSFGVFSTYSFYPAHHITTGEGGAVASYNGRYAKIINSFRDWGRDCWCLPGKENTCNKRFSWQCGHLPYGYDHKYIYSHLGFNMKMTEMQAACGAAQMQRLPEFVFKRRRNFRRLHENMKVFEEYFVLPSWHQKAKPSWFGYPITIRDGVPFSRAQITQYLESKGIATRTIFGGNIMKQPAFIKRQRIGSAGEMIIADKVMTDSFWVGLWPGLSLMDMDFIFITISAFLQEYA